MCDGDDTLCVAAFVAGPAGIDQQRIAAGRDEQRGLAALHVDKINVQASVGGLLGPEHGETG